MVKPKIIIEVEAYWEKRPDELSKILSYEPKTQFKGGWTITRCKGHPQINGGHSSPDFDYTPDSLKQSFIDQYTDWYDGKYEIIVKLKITKDDRNPTMDSYF